MSFGTGFYPWDFALKFIFTVVTLSVGFQGGEVTPLFAIGASLGAVLGTAFGMPVPFAAALGYAAVFASATNTLFAPIFIGAEVFGYDAMPFFFVVCVIAYVSADDSQSIRCKEAVAPRKPFARCPSHHFTVSSSERGEVRTTEATRAASANDGETDSAFAP
jgi:H+/Cl- antiporter ClcA